MTEIYLNYMKINYYKTTIFYSISITEMEKEYIGKTE